jgi:hypothetical protein|tara:strand:- start:794 stop:1174 length:381 start_codon:yes stop_codon:yes gene_type:complete
MIGTPWSNLVFVKVVSATAIEGAFFRWSYDVQLVKFQNPASGVPTVPTEGTWRVIKAFNIYEYANTATTAMGISIASLPTGFSLDSVPVGSIVPASIASGSIDDTSITSGTLFMIQWPNQFNGTCE